MYSESTSLMTYKKELSFQCLPQKVKKTKTRTFGTPLPIPQCPIGQSQNPPVFVQPAMPFSQKPEEEARGLATVTAPPGVLTNNPFVNVCLGKIII